MKTRSAPPKAASLIESLRGMGYTPSTALADVIDNSLSAGATKVRIDFGWQGDESYIRVSDDGRGMTESQLDEAMVLGSMNPLEARASDDLGRFGMGLKTASLSQARRLTVASKTQEGTHHRCWDLDFIAGKGASDWALLLEPFASSRPLTDGPLADSYSTVVVWELLDRILSKGYGEKEFLALIEEVEHHLAMTFHKFLEGTSPSVRMFINGEESRHRIAPWDPYLRSHEATSATPLEHLQLSQRMQGFVLPHRDKLSDKEFAAGGGPAGWVSRQGFYVYRGRRLLLAGSWLGLGEERAWPKDDLHRLARICLELPNHVDSDWHIDIKKSVAKPPLAARSRLIELARIVRANARRVFTHRASTSLPTRGAHDFSSAWVVSETTAGARYKIDDSHPVVASVLEDASVFAGRIRQLFRVIEETVPIQRIWLDAAETVDARPPSAYEAIPPDLLELLRDHFEHLVRRGLSPDIARAQMLKTAPFHRFPAAVAALEPDSPDNP